MTARIFRPSRNVMQSGKRKTRNWVLVYEPEEPRTIDPLMGYTSSRDMKGQIRLRFDTREDAVAYAERKGIEYRVEVPRETREKRVAYADNFKSDRRTPWTH